MNRSSARYNRKHNYIADEKIRAGPRGQIDLLDETLRLVPKYPKIFADRENKDSLVAKTTNTSLDTRGSRKRRVPVNTRMFKQRFYSATFLQLTCWKESQKSH